MKEYIIPEQDVENLRLALYKIYSDWLTSNEILSRNAKPGMHYVILPNGVKIDLCGSLMTKVSGKIFNDVTLK